jgi:hypothetical protein
MTISPAAYLAAAGFVAIGVSTAGKIGRTKRRSGRPRCFLLGTFGRMGEAAA